MQKNKNPSQSFHINILNEEFSRRVEKNTRYSMRAFAKQLEIHPSALSRILAGKQRMSTGSALTISNKIGLSGDTCRLFLQSVIEEQKSVDVAELGAAVEMPDLKVHPHKISEENYAIIAQLMCLALRELMMTIDFKPDPKWIAERLGLSVDQVQQYIKTLLEAGLMEEKDGQYVYKDRHLTAVNPQSSSAVRQNLQNEILVKATESLHKDPFDRRAHYGMTMAINPERLETANKMILDFLETLCDFLEVGERKEVYQLAVQLFPLTKSQETIQ